MSDKKQIECKMVGCTLKGYWIEASNGKKLLCFKVPHRKEKHVIKLDLETIQNELNTNEKNS
jgi:hypothetical protein